MSKPKVSVIIPFYNVEQYIGECIESVLKQTLKDIEVICVNDGSNDKSEEIVKEFLGKNDNIILITKENGGLSSARNAAINIATGDFIYFLDSDDCILPNTLEESYKKAINDQLDIVIFNTSCFFESEELQNRYHNFGRGYIREGNYSAVQTGPVMFSEMKQNNEFYVPVWLQLFRGSLIKENGLNFYEGIIHEDNLFTFQCFMLAKRVGYIEQCYHRRRIRNGSIMTKNKSMKNVQGYIVCYTEALRFLYNQYLKDEVKTQALDFLHGLYRNGMNIYWSLDKDHRELGLKDNFYIEHFLDVARRQYETQEKNKREIEKLKKELDKLKNSYSYRLGKVLLFIPKKIGLFVQKFKKYLLAV